MTDSKHAGQAGQVSSSYEKDLARLRELIAAIDIAMLTTRDDDGSLRARPMGTQSKSEFNGTVHFFSYIDSHKTLEVEANRHVNIAYADPGSNKYASLSGTARITQDKAQIKQHWNESLKVWFPDGLEDPKLALLSVEVSKAEFWDSPSKPVALLEMAKAYVSGTAPKMGDDKKLDLNAGTSTKTVN